MASEDEDIPETGAVFTFGKSRFAENVPSKFWIRNDKVTQVSCGDDHTAFITESGRLYTFGANEWGQLGHGHTKSTNKPGKIKALKHENISVIGSGRSHTLVCTKAGQVFAFGAGGEGQLGVADSTSGLEAPKQITALPEQQYKLSAGTDHSAALTADGTLYMWGGSSEGQLGFGNVAEVPTPRELSFDTKVKQVSCGYYHTSVVTEDGKLYTFGENENGKLGLSDGKLNRTNIPQHVDGIKDPVKYSSCGNNHTAAITENGDLYTFGDGSNGQLGLGPSLLQVDTPEKVTRLGRAKCKFVSCGESHTAVITEKGSLFTFGDGRMGKLGQGDESFCNLFKPTKVDRFHGFEVQNVSCGGCHMVILAVKRSVLNGHMSTESESEETMDPLKLSSHLRPGLAKSLHATPQDGVGDGITDLSASLNSSLNGTARGRRRDRESSPLPPLARTLPPLGSSKKTLQSLNDKNTALNGNLKPMDHGRIPRIKSEEGEGVDEVDFGKKPVSFMDEDPLGTTHFSQSGSRNDMKPMFSAMHKVKRKGNEGVDEHDGGGGKVKEAVDEQNEESENSPNEKTEIKSPDEEETGKENESNKEMAIEEVIGTEEPHNMDINSADETPRPVPAPRRQEQPKKIPSEDEEDDDDEDDDDDEEDDDDDEDDSEEEDEEDDKAKMNKKPAMEPMKVQQSPVVKPRTKPPVKIVEEHDKKIKKNDPTERAIPKAAPRVVKKPVPKEESEEEDDEDDDDEDDDEEDDDEEDDDDDEDDEDEEDEEEIKKNKNFKSPPKTDTKNKQKQKVNADEDEDEDDDDDDDDEEDDDDDEDEDDETDTKSKGKSDKKNEKSATEEKKVESPPKSWQFWKRKGKEQPEAQTVKRPEDDNKNKKDSQKKEAEKQKETKKEAEKQKDTKKKETEKQKVKDEDEEEEEEEDEDEEEEEKGKKKKTGTDKTPGDQQKSKTCVIL